MCNDRDVGTDEVEWSIGGPTLLLQLAGDLSFFNYNYFANVLFNGIEWSITMQYFPS